MAAAADARRRERLQHIGHLPPVPKPATRKEELQQLLVGLHFRLKMGYAESSLTVCCVIDSIGARTGVDAWGPMA